MPKGVNYPLYVPPSCLDVAELIAALRPDSAIALLRQKAQSGDGSAAALLAFIHLRGAAPKEGFKDAAKQCRAAAIAGDPFAKFVLARIALSGGTLSDGLYWLRASCDQAFAPALSHMGLLMTDGVGFPEKRRREALHMYWLAIRRRHVPALSFIARHMLRSRNPIVWFTGLLLAPVAFIVGVLVFVLAPFRIEIFAHVPGDEPPLFKRVSPP